MVLHSVETANKRNAANGAGNRRVLTELANRVPLSPCRIKDLGDEIVHERSGRMLCSSYRINTDNTVNLGNNGILSIDGIENDFVRDRVNRLIDEEVSKTQRESIRADVLGTPTTPCASSAAHSRLYQRPKTPPFSDPTTPNQTVLASLSKAASHIPDTELKKIADNITFWHHLHTGHVMTSDEDGVVALRKGVVTIDDVPPAVVRRKVRKFIKTSPLISNESRGTVSDAVAASGCVRRQPKRQRRGPY